MMPSLQHETREEEAEGRAVPVADAPPGDTAPTQTEVSASGKRGIPVLIAPFQPGGGASDMSSRAFQGFLVLHEEDNKQDDPRKKWFKEMRGWLMVLATVAASVTYQAGLNPPGGFWQDNGDGHKAGNPVLRDTLKGRYQTFYYFNATAFVTSLVIMVLLMSERFYHTEAKLVALMLTTVIDLASLVGAYIAGTTRYMSSCVYIIVITCVAFVAVIYIGEVMPEICAFVLPRLKCMRNLAMRKWFPVPADVVTNALPEAHPEARERRKKQAARSKRGPACCPCCARPATTSNTRDVEEQL
ncbi:uncharacterized protein LOC100830684 [Brachypodium distachyon]|uniref:PGG domain-containing protein n=1 Tax=Brachypodium distachyon TaxID=15368 RepID=A0A2K2DP61_BRADI|nr:uncharacterized protein LOC100830684 [Brachypodium distachyon]PNT76062.1 hypothetical protein BRADI_1g43525v3 [Brachypodium distachyon]|eukprot:XP_003560810.2 uncharacterized protein LOC100830684 [Brachypodium distachyon]